jgi:hypothetical protein
VRTSATACLQKEQKAETNKLQSVCDAVDWIRMVQTTAAYNIYYPHSSDLTIYSKDLRVVSDITIS